MNSLELATPEDFQRTPNKLPVFETMRIAWQKTKGVKKTLWVPLAFGLILTSLTKILAPQNFLLDISCFLITILLFSAIVYVAIRRVANLPISVGMILRPMNFKLIVKAVLTNLISIVFAVLPFTVINILKNSGSATDNFLGVLLSVLEIPSILFILFLSVRFSLSVPLVLDRNLGLWMALKTSYIGTKGNFWRLLTLFILNGIIVFLSALPLGIGLIWTFPYSYVAIGVQYQKLFGIKMAA